MSWRDHTKLPLMIVSPCTLAAASGRAVGSTRFLNIARQDRRVEIGSTWIGWRPERLAVTDSGESVSPLYRYSPCASHLWELMSER